jgi:hypothetical protein
MKKIKLLLAILIGLFALTQSKAQITESRQVFFNNYLKFNAGTGTTNRLVGKASSTGYMNFITIGSGLTLSNNVLSASGGGSVDTSNLWNIRGNANTANRKLGTTNAWGFSGYTNNIKRFSIDSSAAAIFRIGAGGSIASFQTTAQNQTHLATSGSYTIRSTTGDITLQAAGTQGVSIGAASASGNKFYVLGNSYLEGALRINDGTQSNGYVLTSDASGNATWQAAGSGSNWGLTGNAGTNGSTNFIGTTDNTFLTLRANNIPLFSVTPSNGWSLGTRAIFGGSATTTYSTFTTPANNRIDAKTFTNGNLKAYWQLNSPDSPQGIVLGTDGAAKVAIDSLGKVGIGTTTPTYQLQLADTTGNGFQLNSGNFAGDYTLSVTGQTNNVLIAATDNLAGTEGAITVHKDGRIYMGIDAASKIGIGTSTINSKLTVTGGDVYITDVGSGLIQKSPDGSCWRLTISDLGVVTATSITCP